MSLKTRAKRGVVGLGTDDGGQPRQDRGGVRTCTKFGYRESDRQAVPATVFAAELSAAV